MSKGTESGKAISRLIIWLASGAFIMTLILSIAGYHYWYHPVDKAFRDIGMAFAIKGELDGTVMEEYSGNPPAKEVKIEIDGKKIKVSRPGSFSAIDLTVGKHLVGIESDKYEKLVREVDIKEGRNKTKFKLCLTPKEAAERWMRAKKENRHDDVYLQLHPDDRKGVRKAKYVAYKTTVQKKFNIRILDYKVENPRPLSTWKHPISRKTYRNVVKVSLSGTLAGEVSGKSQKSAKRWDAYMQKLNGRWVFFAAH